MTIATLLFLLVVPQSNRGQMGTPWPLEHRVKRRGGG